MKNEITYKDLSTPLKIIVVYSWFSLGITILMFLIGVIEGILGI
jgi:hypothetical protein